MGLLEVTFVLNPADGLLVCYVREDAGLHTVGMYGPIVGCGCTGTDSSLRRLEGLIFESLPSDMGLLEVTFVLNPVLLLCYFLGSLARHRLGEFS